MNQLRRSIFSIHFCLTSRAKKSRLWCSHLERIQSQHFLLTVKILYFLTSIEIPLLNGFSGLGDRDYKPSADLLDLFKTVSTEFSTGESSSAVHVVKSEVFDTVLGYGISKKMFPVVLRLVDSLHSEMGTLQVITRILSSSRKLSKQN